MDQMANSEALSPAFGQAVALEKPLFVAHVVDMYICACEHVTID